MPKTYIEKRLGKTFEEATKEELLSLIDDLKDKKKYGLVWEEQVEEVEEFLKQHYPVLKEVKEREIKTDDEKPTNLLIEGDNLHALNTLLYTHREKVDVIYIDPPYNTGNKDFVYNDRYVDAEDSWRHSKWLSFMEKRLRLARELLRNDGVIYISIDDYEFAQLKLLCDQIFGEEKMAGIIHRRKNRKPHNAGKTMSISYEFILVYYKEEIFKLAQDFSKMLNDEKGNYAIYPVVKSDKKLRTYLFKSGMICEKSNLKKGIVKAGRNENLNIEILDEPIVKNEILMNDIRIKGRFCLTDERGKLSEAMNSGNIFINVNGFPKEKRYRGPNDYKIDNHHWDIEKGKNEDGDQEIKNIFGIKGRNNIFSYPKPIALIEKILSNVRRKDAVVLDFFAGSGTTGHAVLELNKEDGGNRQFILVTNNENNIAEEVTYERLKRVIHGYTTPKGKEVEGLGGNLKYYKTDFISKDNYTMEIKMKLAEKFEELLTIKENCFNLHKEDPLYKIFTSSNKALAIYNRTLEVSSLTTLQNELLECPQHERILYVLSLDDAEELSCELQQLVEAGIQVKPIPKKIKEMYDQALE